MSAPSIAIIGAGPCGLTLARLLEGKGIDYVVYERDASPDPSTRGGSLDLRPMTGQLALRECGLFEQFKERARYEDTVFAICNQGGETILEIGAGRDAPEIDRSELRQLLLDSIPKYKIKWDHVLASAAVDENHKAVLKFDNGAVLSGPKLVVGADGAWSKVLSMVAKVTPVHTGKSILESTIASGNPVYESLAGEVRVGSSLSIGSGKYIMAQRQGGGSYRVWFGLQAPESIFGRRSSKQLDTQSTRDLLLSQYADWSEHNKDIIRHSPDFDPYPLYSLSVEDMSWESVPGVTLAGDAAHLCYPGGKGVNMAMTDALKLATKISEHGLDNIDAAVREYEADMFPRAVGAIAESKAMEQVMYNKSPRAFVELIYK